MKKLFALIAVAIALLAAPQVAPAQTAGDILLPQRSGTSNLNLFPVGSGGAYAILRSGTCALSSGTKVVSDANVTANSLFLFTGVGTTNAGSLTLGTIVSGTSFAITSTSGSDARVVHWWFLKQ